MTEHERRAMLMREARGRKCDHDALFGSRGIGPVSDDGKGYGQAAQGHYPARCLHSVRMGGDIVITRDGTIITTADDLQSLLFVNASDREADALQDLMLRVGLLVKCDAECGWTNPAGAIGGRCEGCNGPVSGRQS